MIERSNPDRTPRPQPAPRGYGAFAGAVLAAALAVVVAVASLERTAVTQPGDLLSTLRAGRRLPATPPAALHLARYEREITEHPLSAGRHVALARLLARHVGESGDEASLPRVESLLRHALSLQPDDATARILLARSLNAQHRFARGGAVAAAALRDDADDVSALLVRVDSHLGVGEYDAAREAVEHLASLSRVPPVLARQAEIAEVFGDDRLAMRLLQAAALAAHEQYLSAQEMAWYPFRVAVFLARRGQLDDALQFARLALRLDPGNLGAAATEAAILARRGNLAEAIERTEQLVERMPHPEIIARLADLHARAKRPEQAAELLALALAAGEAGGEAEDRVMARLLADLDMNHDEAVRRARRDAATRDDLDASDTLAWTLFRAGEFDEAAEHVERALRTGSRRADYHDHAARIYEALGQHARAREHRATLRAIDPRFETTIPVAAAEFMRVPERPRE